MVKTKCEGNAPMGCETASCSCPKDRGCPQIKPAEINAEGARRSTNRMRRNNIMEAKLHQKRCLTYLLGVAAGSIVLLAGWATLSDELGLQSRGVAVRADVEDW